MKCSLFNPEKNFIVDIRNTIIFNAKVDFLEYYIIIMI